MEGSIVALKAPLSPEGRGFEESTQPFMSGEVACDNPSVGNSSNGIS